MFSDARDDDDDYTSKSLCRTVTKRKAIYFIAMPAVDLL